MATGIGCGNCGAALVCGIGGYTGPQPGDPSTNATLSARAVFNGIRVSWTWPSTNPHAVAHVRLWRNSANSFASATQIAVVANNFYLDEITGPVQAWYYWIEIVSVNGTVSAPIGPAYGQSVETTQQLLELLTGQIREGHLATSLRGDINSISVINANLLDEIQSIQNENISFAQALQAAQDGTAQALTFITTIDNSMVSDQQAIAERIDFLAATLRDQWGAVVQTSRVEIDAVTGKINGLWNVKVNTNGMVGGFGIVNDGQQIEAGFEVDKFWIGRTAFDKVLPFMIIDGTVYMNSAMIQNAAITNAKIGNGQITTAKIADAQITTAKIGAAQVDTLQIAGGAVTSMQIVQTGTVGVGDGATANAISLWIDMGANPSSGVVLLGMMNASSGGNSTSGMRVIRARDNVVLADLPFSLRSGFVDSFTITAYDPAPVSGGNNYLLRLYNTTTGPGSNVGFTAGATSLIASGGKR